MLLSGRVLWSRVPANVIRALANKPGQSSFEPDLSFGEESCQPATQFKLNGLEATPRHDRRLGCYCRWLCLGQQLGTGSLPDGSCIEDFEVMLGRLLPKLLVSSFATIYPSMWEAVRGRGAPGSRVQPPSRARSFAQDGQSGKWRNIFQGPDGSEDFSQLAQISPCMHCIDV